MTPAVLALLLKRLRGRRAPSDERPPKPSEAPTAIESPHVGNDAVGGYEDEPLDPYETPSFCSYDDRTFAEDDDHS